MLDKLAKIGVIVVAAGLVVGVVSYFVMREAPRTMPAVLEEVAKKASRDFAEAVPVERDVNDVLFLVVQRGGRDEERQFRDILKRDVQSTGKYRVKTWEDVQSKLRGIGKLLEQAGLIPDEPPDSIEDARKLLKILAASNVRIDGMLLARVVDFIPGDHGLGAKVTVEGELHNLASAKTTPIPPKSAAITSALDYSYLSHRIEDVSFIGRFLGWFVMAAVLPFLLKGVVSSIVAKRRNELNAALLVGLTLADVVLGWILIASLGYGWGTFLVLAILAGAMGYYNHDAIEYIEKHA